MRTITGRIRGLPHINAAQPHARAYAERQAVNTVIQGSAGDVIKTAMDNIDVIMRSYFRRVALALKKGDQLSDARMQAFIACCMERSHPCRCVCDSDASKLRPPRVGWHDGDVCLEALLRCVRDTCDNTTSTGNCQATCLPTPQAITANQYGPLSASLLIMQLHDEVVMEVPLSELEISAQIIEYCMIRAAPTDEVCSHHVVSNVVKL